MKLNKTVANIYKNVELIKMMKTIIRVCKEKQFKFTYPVDDNNIYLISGVSAFGQCYKNTTDKKTYIALNETFVANCIAKNKMTFIENTLIHEICHSLENADGHGEQWKYYARCLGNYFNQTIKRCGTTEESKLLPRRTKSRTPYKYKVVCVDCSRMWRYKSKCNVVKNYARCTCPYCKTQHLKLQDI